MGTVKVLAIDLYGALLDTSSITAVLPQFIPAGKVHRTGGSTSLATSFISAIPSLPHARALIFPNGAPLALSKSPIQDLRDMKYVSVNAVKRYKPDPKTYEHLTQTQKADIGDLDPRVVHLMSANPFDVAGGRYR